MQEQIDPPEVLLRKENFGAVFTLKKGRRGDLKSSLRLLKHPLRGCLKSIRQHAGTRLIPLNPP